MSIRAVIYSDDKVMTSKFDAEPWFQQASDNDIVFLVDNYWSEVENYGIVIWASKQNPEIAKLLKYCKKNHMGFECVVYEKEAKDWISNNIPDLIQEVDDPWAAPQFEEPATPFVSTSSTLVIHPTDQSTTFLNIIYAGKGYDVLTSYRGDLDILLPRYDRVIMMGHGWTDGMFSKGNFKKIMVIDEKSVPGLKGKNNTYIWCKAATFVEQHGLKGYSTGMFISEVGEAAYFKIKVDQETINYSNLLFANIMHKCIDQPNLQTVLQEYDGDCPVIQYNRDQMRQF